MKVKIKVTHVVNSDVILIEGDSRGMHSLFTLTVNDKSTKVNNVPECPMTFTLTEVKVIYIFL